MKRYPGIRPFRIDEQHLFFGRDTDIERLLRLIDLQQVVILYGKSGYGKSSLLSAGVLPRLQADGLLQPWEIRLGPYKPGESLPPADSLRLAVGRRGNDRPILPSSLAEPSLWQLLKNLQTTENKRFLLVFDQFEELFTYPPEQVLEFKKQLAEALFSIVPKRYEKALASANLPPETEDAIYTPFELKVVFSIRADRMSLLNNLKDYLPNLLQHGYELDALDEGSAREAILRPAKLPNIEFETPPFSFAPDALNAIFTALRNEHGRIETSTLQIVCKHVEDNIVYGWMNSGRREDGTSASTTAQRIVSAADLGEISGIFSDFYENTIAGLAQEERNPARHLIEDVLIKDGIRLPFAEQALLAQPGVSTDLLQRLSAASLLRVERDDQGRMLYEVGHDTLVRPIEEAAKARREAEKREADERRIREDAIAAKEQLMKEAERQLQERKKIEAGRRRNLVIGLCALILLGFAFFETWVAGEARKKAEAMTKLANEKTDLATRNDSIARFNTARADTLLYTVEIAKVDIQRAEREIKLAQYAAETQKQLAIKNLEMAERTGEKVVHYSLKDAQKQIGLLAYHIGSSTIHAASELVIDRPMNNRLGALRPLVAKALMEPAFFFIETNQYFSAQKEVEIIAKLLNKELPVHPLKNQSDSQKRLVDFLQSCDTERYAELYRRYYGEFATIPSGTDTIGGQSEGQLIAAVSSFRLSTTETTWRQYMIFCTAAGYPEPKMPGWGLDGDNPVVNVSWYDAVVYCNWRSKREGLRPVYVITDSLSRTQVQGWNVSFDYTANGFRLPMEAEWEYAARAGTNFEYAGDSLLRNVGWYNINSGGRTHTVAQKKSNKFGLYDMSGNAWEWCHDWYTDYPKELVKDYFGPNLGSSRVIHGGGWYYPGPLCRVAYRDFREPDFHTDGLGFRLAKALQ